jgi:hypothetical protein
MKRISTKTHGLIDYAWAAVVPALPRLLQTGPTTTPLLVVAGLGALAYSLLTQYELGALKVLPMTSHLTLDVLSGVALVAASFALTQTTAKERTLLLGLGSFALTVALNTETRALALQPYRRRVGRSHTRAPFYRLRTR